MINFSVKGNVRFVIPSYQRGYRWHKEDAEKLLQDLLTHKGNCYCLQPLELQKLEDESIPSWISRGNPDYVYYRVVDGQQRLTTVAIIAHILGCPPSWDICYDTEEELLSNMLPCKTVSPINNFFRKQVYDAVKEFISDAKRTVQDGALLKKYFGKDESRQIVFPTHYLPTDDKNDPEGQNAFTRLNAGKTPLTSSELIRALYMVQDNGLSENQRIEIAKEWELIENTLKQEQYWRMFKAGSITDTPTRIDLLFALVLKARYQNHFNWDNMKINPRLIFETLETEYYNEKIDLQKLWHEVIRCFWWIQSCYEDVETYNYLGWISLCTDNKVFTIYQDFLNNSAKDDFRKILISKIRNNEICDTPQKYGNPRLKDLLLLFNVLECNNSKERFRFDLLDSFDVEHIDSQTPNDLSKEYDRRDWLKSIWDEYPETHETILQEAGCLDEDFDAKEIELLCKLEFSDSFKKRLKVISQQEPNDLINDSGRYKWLKSVWDEYPETHGTILQEAGYIKVCKSEFSDDFKKRIQQIRSAKNEDSIPDEHGLGNLVLLNSNINRSYKNAVFPRKRKKIIEAHKKGLQYIPPCTLKLFMKFYTPEASCITEWLGYDFESYQSQMKKLLDDFLKIDIAGIKASTSTLDIVPISPDPQASVNSATDHSLPENAMTSSTEEKLIGEISFPELMDHYHIRIPKIQRLYVQGRPDSYGQNCLHGFAQGLVDSVIKGTAFPLDMIYGITNNGKGNTTEVFFPLDGQQRLTTLLLLAWLCGKVGENWKLDYESRRATEIFIEELLKTEPPPINCKDEKDVCTRHIEKQGWFLNVWKQDPGIAGMLRMLDSLYDKLAQSEQTNYNLENIKFSINYLDVSDKSYDHIFLKMNSRGRQLTSWENIKAVLDQNLSKAFSSTEDIQKWKKNIDLNWPENLWNSFDNQDISALDTCMMEIIDLAAKYAGYIGEVEDVFAFNEWLVHTEESGVKDMFQCANNLFSATEIVSSEMLQALTPKWSTVPCKPDFNDRNPEFFKNLAAYFAVCFSINPDWVRVIWNITENCGIDKSNFPTACRLIKELSAHADDILDFLANKTNRIESKFAQNIVAEERFKAQRIIVESSCKPSILSMEAEPFFHGNVSVQMYSNDGEVSTPEKWDIRHKKLLQYQNEGFRFGKDLLAHLLDYSQVEFCFRYGDFTYGDQNYHHMISRRDIVKVIAEMLDGSQCHIFTWKNHEPTANRIFRNLVEQEVLDVFKEHCEDKACLKWYPGGRLYLHQSYGSGFFLLNSPLYEILDWLEKKGKIKIPDDQRWSGIFHYDPVSFKIKDIKFGSDGTSIWVDGCPREPLFTGGENPAWDSACEFSENLANKFLECCQRIYDKYCNRVAAEQDDQGGQG